MIIIYLLRYPLSVRSISFQTDLTAMLPRKFINSCIALYKTCLTPMYINNNDNAIAPMDNINIKYTSVMKQLV